MGLLDELRDALRVRHAPDGMSAGQMVRDLVYELAGAKDRDLAVDVLIHATGIAEYDELTLRDYAAKHGLSHEGFRKQVIAMQRRLNLPRRSMEHRDAN
jgi:plasmid stability protein